MGDGRRGAALLALLGALAAPTAGRAERPDLERLRTAFTEAYAAESKGRFGEALTTFEAIQRERDTASVRFRIGACLEGLGRAARARAVFASVREVARPSDDAVVHAAEERAANLDARLAALVVRLEGEAGHVRVSVDGEPRALVRGQLTERVEPGPHVVAATRDDMDLPPVRLDLTAGSTTLIVLGVTGPAVKKSVPAAPAPARDEPAPGGLRGLGAAGVATGAALLVGSAIALGVREAAIGSIEETCPGGVCPAASASAVESSASRARAMVPLAIVLGSVGTLALGSGMWLLLRPARAAPGATFALAGSF